MRRAFDARKVGHAGTLDPLATGVLPIALGEATKTVAYAVDGAKHYRFTIAWGIETDTDDALGKATARSDVLPTRAAIEAPSQWWFYYDSLVVAATSGCAKAPIRER